MEEIWKIIPGFPDYEISNMGQLRSYRCRRGKGRKSLPTLKIPALHKERGYLFAGVANEEGYKIRDIHKLVAITFLDKVEGKNTIDHINQNKLDNRVCNLRWANQTEQNINRKQISELHHIYKTKNNKTSPYVVEIRRYGKRVFYEYFTNLDEAKKARDEFLRCENNIPAS